MFQVPVRDIMEQKKFLTVPPDITVREVASMMADQGTGAALVVAGGSLVGIFTERDAVFRVIARGKDVNRTPLSEVMTAEPKTIDPTKSYGHALMLMQENGFRHVPVIEHGLLIGIVSSRNAMDPDLEEFVSEARRRERYR